MINTSQINKSSNKIKTDNLKLNVNDSHDQSGQLDQNYYNSFQSFINSNSPYKSTQLDQYKDSFIMGDGIKWDENYQINIDGVNKRRALFGVDMYQQQKIRSNEVFDLSNQLLEFPSKIIDKKNQSSEKVKSKCSIDNFERSNLNLNVKQIVDNSKESNLSPSQSEKSQSLKLLSPSTGGNRKSQQLAEYYSGTTQKQNKFQGFSDRLRQVSQMMQSGHQDDNQSQSNSLFKNLASLSAIAKFKSKKTSKYSFSRRLSKRRWSNLPTQYDKNNEEVQKSKNYFVILSLVKKFIKSCVLRISYKDFNLLESKHFKMIGDVSYFTKKKNFQFFGKKQTIQKDNIVGYNDNRLDVLAKKRANLSQYISAPLKFSVLKVGQIKFRKMFIDCKLFSKLLNKKAILPNSLYVIIWDFIIILIMLVHLIVIPVKTCFYIDMSDTISIAILYFIPVICFTFDILIAFNTGIYEFGVVVVEQKLISRAYWKNKFPYHVCIISTLLLNFKFQNIIIELFAIYLRLNQILQRMNKVNQHFQITFKLPTFSELFKLVALVLFVAHLCGSGFHYVGSESTNVLNQDMSWIIAQKIQNENWMHKYIYSMYFAIVTMVTIGYGDVYPTNIYERIYVVFMTLFSCGIFAYCINTIGNIFLEQNYKQKAFQQKLFDIQKYLQSKSINKEAQIRVFKYLEYLNEQTDEFLTKGQVILSECSQDLREEILKDYYGKILLNLKILQNNFSTEFIQALSIKMKEKRFGPGEIIIQQGNRLKNLYFLSNGDIEYYIQNGQKVFDFRLFVTETVCPYSIKSTLNTTMAYLTFEDFQTTLQEFNLDYEKYCMIRDQFLYSDRYDNQCLSCGQFGHDIQGCSQIHYNVNKSIFLQRIARSPFQPRGCFNSESILPKQILRNKSNCLKSLRLIKKDLKILRWRHAENTYNDYQNINVFELSSMKEKDREFYMRCPKIKNYQIQKNEQSSKNMKDTCGIKLFDEFNNQESINNSSSSASDSFEDSGNDSDDFITAKQEGESSLQNTFTQGNILFSQDQNQQTREISSKRRISLIKNQEIANQYVYSGGSIRTIKDKKHQNLTQFNQSALSLDLDDPDRNQKPQIPEIKGSILRYRSYVPSILQDDNLEGEVVSLRRQLNEALERLEYFHRKDDEHFNNKQDEVINQSKNQLISSRFIMNDPPSTLNDNKDASYLQYQQQTSDKIKNLRFNFQRREGVRKTTLKHNQIQKRNDEKHLTYVNSKISEPRETDYEMNDQSSHIFGVFKFSFDKMKEFNIYYPKYNYTNIVKSYKKIFLKFLQFKYRKSQYSHNIVGAVSQRQSNTPNHNCM